MKIQGLQEDLKKAVNLTSRFISPKAQLPILGNILLKTDKTKLILSSTNLETSVSTSIGAKIVKEGEITVPGRIFNEIISNLSAGQIDISVENEQIKISSGSFKSTVQGINSSEYPVVPNKINNTNSLSLPFSTFSKALSKCLFSASNDETRPVLTGVLFVFKDNLLYLVATDGYRLSQFKMTLSEKPKGDIGKIVIPKSILMEVSKLEGVDELIFSYSSSDNQVLFKAGNTTLSSRVIQGEYPDYEKIIPKSEGIKVSFSKEDLLQAVRLASVFARESANITKILLGKDSLSVYAQGASSGNQENKIEALVEGELPKEKLEIAFNFHFLEEFLHCIEGETVLMNISGASAPGKFIDPSEKEFLHLIMPIKI